MGGCLVPHRAKIMVADSLLHSNRFGNEKRTLKSETEAGKFINCPIGLNRPDKIVTGKIVSGGLIRHVTNLIGLLYPAF